MSKVPSRGMHGEGSRSEPTDKAGFSFSDYYDVQNRRRTIVRGLEAIVNRKEGSHSPGRVEAAKSFLGSDFILQSGLEGARQKLIDALEGNDLDVCTVAHDELSEVCQQYSAFLVEVERAVWPGGLPVESPASQSSKVKRKRPFEFGAGQSDYSLRHYLAFAVALLTVVSRIAQTVARNEGLIDAVIGLVIGAPLVYFIVLGIGHLFGSARDWVRDRRLKR